MAAATKADLICMMNDERRGHVQNRQTHTSY